MFPVLALVLACRADPVSPTSSPATNLVDERAPMFSDIVVSTNYGCVLRADGAVLCWGQDPTHARAAPVAWTEVFEIDGLSDVTLLAASEYLFCAVSEPGTVSCWSTKEAGPRRHIDVFGGVPIVELAVDDDVCVRSAAGEVRCWGHEAHDAQLVFDRAIDIDVGPRDGCALDAAGEIWCWDLGQPDSSRHVATFEGATSVWISHASLCVRRRTGEVACRDRVGPGAANGGLDPLDSGELRSLALAEDHACYVVADGAVRCFGNNAWAQLGAGTTSQTADVVTVADVTGADAVAAVAKLSCALTGDAALCWGTRGRGWRDRPTVERSVVIRDATSLVVDADFTCVTTTASEVLCWGSFHHLDFDAEGLARAATPTPVGIDLGPLAKVQDRCLLDRRGELRCWSIGGVCAVTRATVGCGPLAIDARYSDVSDFARGKIDCLIRRGKLECTDTFGDHEPLATPALRDVTRVHTSPFSSRVCVVHGPGHVSCFPVSRPRSDDPVSIGAAVRVPTLSQVESLFGGPGSTDCAITREGQVWCWADGDAPTRADLPAGDQGVHYGDATCVRTFDGEVACSDALGQLTWLDLHDVAELRGGSAHVCALDHQGVVTCIGDGGSGQLGTTPAGLMATPVRVQLTTVANQARTSQPAKLHARGDREGVEADMSQDRRR
ncbi:BNR repeat domain protein [Enhygromyxa salina]|uniref:BNR repeat domain protein n=1 Tax=Enhygromyxa salina TaxID=215803 RepID=A0A0C2D2P1_9BACT|nr:BNR repeat domain protein [Enhygromyxa salina]